MRPLCAPAPPLAPARARARAHRPSTCACAAPAPVLAPTPVLATALFAVVAALTTSSCAATAGACTTSADCGAGLVCAQGSCVEATPDARDAGATDVDGGAVVDAGDAEEVDAGGPADAGASVEVDAGVSGEVDAGVDAGPAPPWWDAAFPRRHRVALVNDGPALDDVPVQVSFLSTLLDATALGDTACVVDEDHATILPVEVDFIRNRTSIWVRVPRVSSIDDPGVDPAAPDAFFVYVGGPPGACPNHPASVWQGIYDAVWHLEDGHDSLERNDLAISGAEIANGRIGRGKETGADKFLDRPEPVGLAFAGDVTVEAWFAAEAFPAGTFANTLVRYGGVGATEETNILYQLSIEQDRRHAVIWDGNNDVHVVRSDEYAVALGDFHHYAWTRVAGGANTFFLDGDVVSVAIEPAVATGGQAATLRIGGNPGIDEDSAFGVLDEVRISDDVKPPEWLDFQVRTMKNEVATLEAAEDL